MRTFFVMICILGLSTFTPVQTKAQNTEKAKLTIIITNIRNNEGVIKLGFFRDSKAFEDEIPAKTVIIEKDKLNNGKLTYTCYLTPGIWGVSALDDEDKDGDMSYNFFGYPTEGYGFADYYHTGLSKPTFSSFKFTLSKGQSKTVTIKIRYM